jgi:hypothetical protein
MFAVAALLLACSAAWTVAQTYHDTQLEYRVESRAATEADLVARFAPWQLAILEKLNRADARHLARQDALVVPLAWSTDELRYSPFPVAFPAAMAVPKLLVVDQPAQAFAAYQEGRLVRWGPVSTGRRAHPTPSGLFHLNWRARGRHSTVNPAWYMEWYVNFQNTRGLALHAYALPGHPASHACIRLLTRDATWIYEWGDTWSLGRRGELTHRGTPLLIVGQYAFGETPPWRSLAHLARGIVLPEVLPRADHVRMSDVNEGG